MSEYRGGPIDHAIIGLPPEQATRLVVWGHGWGHNRTAFAPLAESLPRLATHLLLDFPGFGRSPPPPGPWGTEDYADAVADLIRVHRGRKQVVVWVGHSFGARVGLQLAARHGDLVSGLFLVAAAGLPRKRNAFQAARRWTRLQTYKGLKRLAPRLGLSVAALQERFGSADYRAAGEMRPVLVKVVNENLSDVARAVRCPTCLVYGADDTETPPDIGQRLHKLIPGSELTVIPGHDHYSVLGSGRHLVLKRLMTFVERT